MTKTHIMDRKKILKTLIFIPLVLEVLALLVFNLINVWFLYTSMMFGVSFSIIGGADGPTAIFIAGSERDIFPLVLLAIVVVLAGIGIVKSIKRKD